MDNRYIRQVLRGTVFEESDPHYHVAEKLEDLNIIKIRKREYIYCKSERNSGVCWEKINIDNDNEYTICPTCGYQVDIDSRSKYECFIAAIYNKGLTDYIIKKINDTDKFEVINFDNGVFYVSDKSGKTLLIAIPHFMTCNSQNYFSFNYVYENPILFLRTFSNHMSHVIDNIRTLNFWDFINMDESQLEDKLSTVLVNIEEESLYEYQRINKLFDDFAEEITWQKFEDWTNEFFSYVKENRKLADKYFSKLMRDKNTIFGSIHVKIGGAGNTDIRLFDKYSYLKPLFYSNSYILDSKNYSERKLSQIKRDHIGKLSLHMGEDPTNPEYAFAFCTTNNIQTTAWDSILQTKRNKGRWVYIIINKSLLIDILINMKGLHLLKNK